MMVNHHIKRIMCLYFSLMTASPVLVSSMDAFQVCYEAATNTHIPCVSPSICLITLKNQNGICVELEDHDLSHDLFTGRLMYAHPGGIYKQSYYQSSLYTL